RAPIGLPRETHLAPPKLLPIGKGIELRRRGRRGRVAEGSREDGPGPRAATDLAGPYLPVIAPAILQRRRGRGRGTRLAGDVGHPRERLLRRPELDLRLQHRIVMRA